MNSFNKRSQLEDPLLQRNVVHAIQGGRTETGEFEFEVTSREEKTDKRLLRTIDQRRHF